MRYSAPVMLFGDAVKAIRRATSSGVVMRPVLAPVALSSWSAKRLVLDAVLLGQLLDRAVRVGPHAGRDGTRRDGDRAHPIGAELLGDDLRQGVERRLGDVVVERAGAREARAGRRDVDDRAPPLAQAGSAVRLTRNAL